MKINIWGLICGGCLTVLFGILLYDLWPVAIWRIIGGLLICFIGYTIPSIICVKNMSGERDDKNGIKKDGE